MRFTFHAFGHPNVTARHKTTLEFTKDGHIGTEADCILGVNADFDAGKLKEFIGACRALNHQNAKISVTAGTISDSAFFIINDAFSDGREIVIRMGRFLSPRTLGVDATKGAVHFKRELVEKLKHPQQKIIVSLAPL